MNIKAMPHGKAENLCICAACEDARDLIRRKAAAFDKLERSIANGQMVTLSNPRRPDQEFRARGNTGVATGASLLDAIEAMVEL